MSRRSYKQNCALARASDVIGERWTLLLLRDLLISPRRFKELHASLRGIGTNLLAARLKDLTAAGIIEGREGDGRASAYALTDAGRALEPAVLALTRWGLTHGPENLPGDHHHDDWDLLALKAMFRPDRAEGVSVSVQFDAPGFQGWARIADGEMSIGLGVLLSADIAVNGTIAGLFVDAEVPSELLSQGRPEKLQAFMAAFALRHRSGHLLVW